jgi:DNA-binding CsgD family transcriptional regulator/tetratricopeptide (TPR) repeat protein
MLGPARKPLCEVYGRYIPIVGVPLADSLVGRDLELQLVRGMVRDVRAGQAEVLLIEGEPGIGKSRLVQSLIAEAYAVGAVVFCGEAHPFERTHPFGVVADALDLRRRSADARRAMIGNLLAGDAERPQAAGGAPDLRYRIVEEILDLLEASCTKGTVALVLEDIHWADDSTLLAFRAMARRLAHVPLLLVASLRPVPRSAELDQLLGEILAAGARLIRLGALAPDEVRALAGAELGTAPRPELMAVLGKAGGNPLWVVEILRSLADEGRLGPGGTTSGTALAELPASFREVVIRRLRYLSEPALSLLRVAAVLGDSVPVADLAAVARREPGELVAQLGEAFQARLLGAAGDGLVFRHQLVHDAIYQEIPGPVRQVMHRDAATALADSGAGLLRVADHLVLGAARGDLQAVDWLRQAAREAVAGSPAVSVALLQRAEALLPAGHPEADLICVELVETMLRAGKTAEGAARAEAVLARRHRPEADLPLRLSVISALSLLGQPDKLLDRAEATVAERPDLPLAEQSLVLAQVSLARSFLRDPAGGQDAAERALAAAERCGDAAMTVWSLAAMSGAVRWRGRFPEAVELTRRAVQLADDPGAPAARLRHPRFFLGMALSDCDLFDEAAAVSAAALEEYEELGSVWLLPDTLALQATVSFLTGNWDDAGPGLEAALLLAQEQGNRVLVNDWRGCLAVMAAARGDLGAARRALAPVEGELSSDAPGFGAEMAGYAASVIAEAAGDTAAAFGILLRFWQLDAERDSRYYHRWLAPALTRLAIAAGRRDLALEVAAAAEAAAALAPGVPTVLSMAARCRGLAKGNPDIVLEAVGLARRGGRLLDYAGSCEDAAAVLAAAGRAEQAKELLSEALAAYEEVGAHAWAARVAAELRRLGVRRGARGPRSRPAQGWAALTATERAVSQLVAEGLTNRDVARRLHISPHTVNTHLRHVFDKLGVSNRTALAAAVAQAPPSP